MTLLGERIAKGGGRKPARKAAKAKPEKAVKPSSPANDDEPAKKPAAKKKVKSAAKD